MSDPAGPDDVMATYERVGVAWAGARDRSLFERPLLERLRGLMPGDRLLDLGCGSGDPIARHMASLGARVTGVDGAGAMLQLFRRTLPHHEAVRADMRHLALGRRFDGILAWDSFFHLDGAAQRAMFPIFAAHSCPGAPLLFTAGPAAGEAIGRVGGEPVYHASLDPGEYREHLDAAGFDVLAYRPEDPAIHGHTAWLARFRGPA
jgi:predicted TPR repeat methyltransferase